MLDDSGKKGIRQVQKGCSEIATTLHITGSLLVVPLFELESAICTEWYKFGIWWRVLGWYKHGEVEAQGLLPDDYLVYNLRLDARLNYFDGQHDDQLRHDLGFFIGMVHGGMSTVRGLLRSDVTTLVVLHNADFRTGYQQGRCRSFTGYEHRLITETYLLNTLKRFAKEGLYVSEDESILNWAIGHLVGELSGRLFPLMGEPQEQVTEPFIQVVAVEEV